VTAALANKSNLPSGAHYIEFSSKGRFAGMEVKTQTDSSGTTYIMGYKIKYNSDPKCDIANRISMTNTTGTSFVGKVNIDTIVHTANANNPVKSAYSVTCALSVTLETNQSFLSVTFDAATG
jgi:hypothetical protein